VPTGEDADPASQRPDDLLHRERQTGRGKAEDDRESTGEGLPHQGRRNQQHNDDHCADGLAHVVARVRVIGPAADQPSGGRGHQKRHGE
jgi:hypothetical protein